MIKKNSNQEYKRIKVLSNNVSKKINPILRKTVSEGTAGQVNVKGYQVGGKTGTAQQPINKEYGLRHKKYWIS